MKTIKNFKSFLESKSGKLYEFGCIMAELEIPNWESILGGIKEDDLYEPSQERWGLEKYPHVTLIYGIHDNISDEEIVKFFENVKSSSIHLEVNGINYFKNKDYDVLKMNVTSSSLNSLNNQLKSFPHTDLYPDYIPHITIAYLLPGMGEKYKSDNLKFRIDGIDKIIYSKTNGDKIEIKLN